MVLQPREGVKLGILFEFGFGAFNGNPWTAADARIVAKGTGIVTVRSGKEPISQEFEEVFEDGVDFVSFDLASFYAQPLALDAGEVVAGFYHFRFLIKAAPQKLLARDGIERMLKLRTSLEILLVPVAEGAPCLVVPDLILVWSAAIDAVDAAPEREFSPARELDGNRL